MEIFSIAKPCALLAELASAFFAGSADRTSRPTSPSRSLRGVLTLAIPGTRAYCRPSPRFPRHRTATKGNEGSTGEFRLADWIVPPVIIPLSLLLLVFAVAVTNG